jgi:tyrosine-specific transport protein
MAALSGAATITGTAIGAGFLGIPYVVAKSGLLIGIIHIIVLGLLILLINLYLGEITLRTKKNHQFPGYAKLYLGNIGRIVMLATMIFGIYSALVAYFIAEGETLSFIIFGSQDYAFSMSFLFFAFVSSLVYFGIDALKKGETIAVAISLAIMAVITIFFLPQANLANFSHVPENLTEWFLPYGVILFSFLSFSALPEVKQELQGKEKLLKKSIIIGALIPIIAYILFTTVTIGYIGAETPEIALIAFGKIPSLLAVVTLFTACFALSNAMRDMYKLDLNLPNFPSWLLAMFIPFIIFCFLSVYGWATFTTILKFGGAITGGLTGILISIMAIRAKKLGKRKPEYKIHISVPVIIILAIIFIAGIIYQFIF